MVMISWVLVLCLSAVSQQSEIVTIEGKKNPELVPQYAAWAATFRFLAVVEPEFPPPLNEHLTIAEQAMIRKESERLNAQQIECAKRGVALRTPLTKLETTNPSKEEWLRLARKIDAQMWEVQLGCRWDVLHARDRVLEQLTPEAQMMLHALVEQRKAGLSFEVPRNGLDRFRQPQ